MTDLLYAVGCGGHVTSDFLFFSFFFAVSRAGIVSISDSAVQYSQACLGCLSVIRPSGIKKSVLIAFSPLSLPLEPMTGYAVFFLELASYDGRRIVALWLGKDEQVEEVV